jgi:RsiW-degrading membrane proteinase PrsW (M82 family)
MKIKSSTWRRYCRVAAFVAMPLALLNFFRPAWWHRTEQNISFFVIILICLSGALMAILRSIGKVEFIYSEKNEKK